MTQRAILLQALASTLPDIKRLVVGFGPPTPNSRGTNQREQAQAILSQLDRYEHTFQFNLERVLLENTPLLSANNDASEQTSLSRSLSDLITHFAAARDVTLSWLSSLRPGEWQRIGLLDAQNPRSIRFLAQALLDHDIAQTNELVQVLAAYQKAVSAATTTTEKYDS